MDWNAPVTVEPLPHWARSEEELLASLNATRAGLDHREAAVRLQSSGPPVVSGVGDTRWGRLLLARFASPLVLILVVAASVSLLLRQWLDALIVLGIVAMTSVLSFLQEYRAAISVAVLRRQVAPRAGVLRDAAIQQIPGEQVVPGDIVELAAGALVPADARVLEARECLVDQALLTGEPEPVYKRPGLLPPDTTLGERSNCVYMGTSVRSGWARAVVVATGARTVYGGIAGRLRQRAPETDFERGLRRYGGMLVTLMLAVVAVVLAINLALGRPVIDTLLFAAALAVGLSPELLPAILTITLSHGARAMARRGVIVKRLDAIENLGSMGVLCTDKTGTLTRGVTQLDGAVDVEGRASDVVLELAHLNAALQSGLRNAIDEAIVRASAAPGQEHAAHCGRVDEVPYDFRRRRMTVIVADPDGVLLITKGAVDNVLAACHRVATGGAGQPLDDAWRARIDRQVVAWSADGYRVLALATRPMPAHATYGVADETDMTLRGFLLFFDPPEPQAGATLASLRALGVEVRMVTGDNRHVARHVAQAIGLPVERMLVGGDIAALDDAALAQQALGAMVYAEIDPGQKERVIRALRRGGRVVGYLGDGINDAPALHAADVGVSVDQAADVAKEAADFVLLRHDLDVLRQGIEEGRRTFANTIKYVFITTSANFGNMVSMAMASLVLPFLPLLAKQILLNNFLSDVPAMGIAADRVDAHWERTPHRWNLRLVGRAMLVFGLTSTCFDLLTFAALLGVAAGAEEFRTGWFVESLLTEVWVLFVVRTDRPFWRSRPAPFLVWSGAAVMLAAIALPYSPVATAMGFVPMPPDVLGLILAITAAYIVVSETSKRWFYRRLVAG
jgi:Mg2+-importing ATPase